MCNSSAEMGWNPPISVSWRGEPPGWVTSSAEADALIDARIMSTQSRKHNPWAHICRYELWKKPTYDPNIPFKRCNVGDMNDLREVAVIAVWFDFSYARAVELLNGLGVPRLLLGDREYFNVNALEEAIFILSELGAPGFQLRNRKRPGRRALWPASERLRPTLEPLDKLTPEWAVVLSGRDLRKRMEAVLASKRKALREEVADLEKETTTREFNDLRRVSRSREHKSPKPKGEES